MNHCIRMLKYIFRDRLSHAPCASGHVRSHRCRLDGNSGFDVFDALEVGHRGHGRGGVGGQQAAVAHLVVRPYGSDGVRVTIGAPEENDALLAFAKKWI